MDVFSYLTIEKPSEGAYREKGSKFLAFAFPVESAAEIKERLTGLKRQYYDARHYCFAWILGPEKKNHRVFDDREPNHSAGDPIIGQIRSRELTNILVVVVRYFGGTKLGVGGLATAYKTAAEEALKAARIVEREVVESFILRYDYPATAEVMRVVKDFDLQLLQQDFSDHCSMQGRIALRRSEKFKERIALMNAMGVAVDLALSSGHPTDL